MGNIAPMGSSKMAPKSPPLACLIFCFIGTSETCSCQKIGHWPFQKRKVSFKSKAFLHEFIDNIQHWKCCKFGNFKISHIYFDYVHTFMKFKFRESRWKLYTIERLLQRCLSNLSKRLPIQHIIGLLVKPKSLFLWQLPGFYWRKQKLHFQTSHYGSFCYVTSVYCSICVPDRWNFGCCNFSSWSKDRGH